MPSSTTSSTRPTLLRTKAHAFCQALLSPPPPKDLLSQFFTSDPVIHEHGPSWSSSRLPFLGRPFVGTAECEEYFSSLSATLKMQLDEGSFPGPEGFTVNAGGEGEEEAVSVVGRGVFESVETGRSWEERFVYVLKGWDDEGRFKEWHVWADPLSAWCAVGEEDVEGWRRGERRS